MSSVIVVAVLGAVTIVAVAGVVMGVVRIPPHVMLAAYAFFLPFGSTLKVPVGPAPFNTVSTLLGLAAAFGLILHLLGTRRSVHELPGTVFFWLLFVAWLGLTLLWSVDPAVSLSKLRILVSLIGFYTLASLIRFDRRGLRWIELAAVAGAMVVAVQALHLAAAGRLHETASRQSRFTFEEGDPNITAATLLLPFVLAVWWAMHARQRTGRGVSLALAGIILTTIVVTGSRGGLVSAGVSVLILVLQSPSLTWRRSAVHGGVLFLSLTLVFLSLPAPLTRHLTAKDSTGRTEIWKVGLAACPQVCDTGSGWGTFPTVYRKAYYEHLGLKGAGDVDWAAHNAFLSTLIEAGFVGLVLMVLGLAVLVRRLFDLPALVRGPPIAAVAGLVTSNMFLSNVNFKYFWFTMTYATLCMTAYRGSASSRTTKPSSDMSGFQELPSQ